VVPKDYLEKGNSEVDKRQKKSRGNATQVLFGFRQTEGGPLWGQGCRGNFGGVKLHALGRERGKERTKKAGAAFSHKRTLRGRGGGGDEMVNRLGEEVPRGKHTRNAGPQGNTVRNREIIKSSSNAK